MGLAVLNPYYGTTRLKRFEYKLVRELPKLVHVYI